MFQYVKKWIKSHPYLTVGLVGTIIAATGGVAALPFVTVAVAIGVKIAVIAAGSILTGAACAKITQTCMPQLAPKVKKAPRKRKPKAEDIELRGFEYGEFTTPAVLREFFAKVEAGELSPSPSPRRISEEQTPTNLRSPLISTATPAVDTLSLVDKKEEQKPRSAARP